MTAIDRRRAIRSVFCSAAVIGLGLAVATVPAQAAPAADKRLPDKADDLISNAQWGPPHRRWGRRRRWVCWRSRGRRICGWRWV